MFVRSRLNKDIVYRKKGKDWVIKAGTVTFIDENQVTAQELRKLYSTRIEIMSRERLEAMEQDIPVIEATKKEPQEKEIVKKPLDEKILDDILTEIKDEIPVKKEEKPEIKVDVVDPIKEAFMSNSGELDIELDDTDDLIIEDTETGDEVPTMVDTGVNENNGNDTPVLDDDKKEEIEKPKKVSKAPKKTNGKRRGRAKKTSVK